MPIKNKTPVTPEREADVTKNADESMDRAEWEAKARQVASLVTDALEQPFNVDNQEYLRVNAVSDEEVVALSRSIAEFLGTPKSRLRVDDVQIKEEKALVIDSDVSVAKSKGSRETSASSRRRRKAAKLSSMKGSNTRPPRQSVSPRKPLSSKNQRKPPSEKARADDEISLNDTFNDDLSVAMGVPQSSKWFW